MNQRGLTVGVLGGMGPDATIDFMSDVLRLTDAEKDQDHIHLVVDQNPAVPNRQQAIRSGTEEVGLALASMARRLEAAGADFLVMPCNTAHAFEASIRAATNRPFISIIEVSIAAVGKLLAADGHVGIMATDGLMDTGIYQRALSAAGFPSLLPQTPQQGDLMGLIHRIKAGDKGTEMRASMAGIAESLVARGAELILAACTEIPLVLKAAEVSVPLVSTTEALARYTVALATGIEPLPGTT